MNKGESNSKKKVFALTILSISMSVALISTPSVSFTLVVYMGRGVTTGTLEKGRSQTCM